MKFFFASAGSEIAEHVIGNRIWIIHIFLQSFPSANTLNFSFLRIIWVVKLVQNREE